MGILIGRSASKWKILIGQNALPWRAFLPGKVSGAWVFRNSRTPGKLIFENLEDGMTIHEIIEQYPVSHDEIAAVLDFVVQTLDSAVS